MITLTKFIRLLQQLHSPTSQTTCITVVLILRVSWHNLPAHIKVVEYSTPASIWGVVSYLTTCHLDNKIINILLFHHPFEHWLGTHLMEVLWVQTSVILNWIDSKLEFWLKLWRIFFIYIWWHLVAFIFIYVADKLVSLRVRGLFALNCTQKTFH